MSTSYSSEQNTDARLSHLIIFVLVMAAGTLFFAVHMLNGWLFNAVELTDHISLLYLPAFLRLMNVLVLGMLWGTIGTAVGGALLFFWMQDSPLMSVLNTTVSAGGAALAVWLMRIQQGRPLLLSRLSDLLKLSLLYALLNALLHHLLWSYLDPAQLVAPYQLFYMVIGDINGAILGALGLRWLARNTKLIDLARQKAQTPAS
jgi:hypothetical protein